MVADTLSRRDEQHAVGGKFIPRPSPFVNGGLESTELATISSPVANWLDVIKEEIESNAEMKELEQRVQEDEVVGP